MVSFALRRTAAALATLLGVLVLVFLLLAAAPGDPAALSAHAGATRGIALSREAVAAFHARYGLDRPMPERFGLWLARAARLDFGSSFLDGRDVAVRIRETLPTTLVLNAAALALALLVAVPCGVFSARRRGGRFDRASGLVFDILFATPTFVTGMVLLLAFAVWLRVTPLFPGSGSGLRGFVLPAGTLALASIAALARFVRACVSDALSETSAAAARARGEGPLEETRRALRRSAVPFAAMGAALVPSMISGSVLVERLFALPGSGRLLADSVFARDYPVVLALTLLAAAGVVAASAIADFASGLLDPRTRDASAVDA